MSTRLRYPVDAETGEILRPKPSKNARPNIDNNDLSILGIYARSVDRPTPSTDFAYSTYRRDRYLLQATSAKLLPEERVGKCMLRCGAGGVEVVYSPSVSRAYYRGVVTCGSVWICPVCSHKISQARRAELNQLLTYGREYLYGPVLLSLTVSHKVHDKLSETLSRMKEAKRVFHASKSWRKLGRGLAGFVTATEVTYGDHGWHPHYHMLALAKASGDTAVDMVEEVRSAWEAALATQNLWCNEHGFDVQGASEAGDYVGKWGAGEEMTLTSAKTSQRAGFSPWQLLKAAYHGDGIAAELFVEYAGVFKGRQQLVWANGLKKRLQIAEQSDEALAAADEAPDYEQVVMVPKALWKQICARMLQSELLDMAEQGGSLFASAWLHALSVQSTKA